MNMCQAECLTRVQQGKEAASLLLSLAVHLLFIVSLQVVKVKQFLLRMGGKCLSLNI